MTAAIRDPHQVVEQKKAFEQGEAAPWVRWKQASTLAKVRPLLVDRNQRHWDQSRGKGDGSVRKHAGSRRHGLDTGGQRG